MTRRKINSEDPAVHAVYMNWLAQLVGMICPRNLFLILGRGSGKTNDILTDRLMDICYDMPGAPIALVGDTYDNLSKNILPSLLDGLSRKGWVENVHYVVDKEPPEVTEDMRQAAPPELRSQLWTPYNRILSYKRKIIFFTGTNITLVSLDRPSSAAGNSYVHLIGDEAKFFPPHKLAKMTKALRGYFVKYGKSVYYRGQTFLTDMPNPNHVGEYDWILKQFSRMNVKDIMMVIKTAFVLNDVRQEVAVAKCDYNTKEIANKEKLLKRWEERFNQVRQNSTFCYVASSYINSDILRPEYFADEFEGDLDDVKISILSTKPRLAAGNMFYAGIGSKHFYNDNTYVPIDASRAFYIRCLPFIRAEESELGGIIGSTEKENLLQHISDKSLSDSEASLVNAIRRYISCLVMAKAIRHFSVSILPESVTCRFESPSQTQKASAVPTVELLSRIENSYLSEAKGAFGTIQALVALPPAESDNDFGGSIGNHRDKFFSV